MSTHLVVTKHSQLNLRKKHPFLHFVIVAFAVFEVGLGLNYWKYTPTFNPWGISKYIIGGLLVVIGGWQLVFLHLWRDWRKVQAGLIASCAVMLAWGIANTEQSFAGKASFAIPLAFVTVAFVQFRCLLESPVNLTTETK